MIYIVLIVIILLFLVFITRLIVIKKNIDKLEKKIRISFHSRTNTIPSIFEVTKNSFSKHSEIFEEILKLRKNELYRHYIRKGTDNKENDFVRLIHMEELIHHELNFIFKVANKHPKLAKKGNFIYLRETIISKSYDISKLIKIYKVNIGLYNKLIDIKNFTIIGLLIPIYKKSKI